MPTLRDTTRDQIQRLRKQRGLTQQQLANILNLYGAHTDRSSVARVEAGTRQLPLGEVFLYALALGVAPVHLVVPIDGDEPIQVTPNLSCSPHEARAWIRGYEPIGMQERRTYFTHVPEGEFPAGAPEPLPYRVHGPRPGSAEASEES